MVFPVSTLIVFVLVFCCNGGRGVARGEESKYQRVCYLDTTAQLRQGAGRFTLADLSDVTLCTHLVFVHALVDPVNFDLAPALQGDFEYYKEVTALKDSHPDLQVLLLVGGPDPAAQQTGVSSSLSEAFSQLLNSTGGADLFADNVVTYLNHFGFDGMELDWRYPGMYGSVQDDVYGFPGLVRKLREKFDQQDSGGEGEEGGGARLVLTVRVSGNRYILQDTVQLDQIIGYIDYLVVTAYDFYLTEPRIGHNSGLFGRNGEPSDDAPLNVDYIVQYLTLYREVPAGQILLGVPSFGHTVMFINETTQAFGAPHNGTGPPGLYTAQPGLLAFYEICSLLNNGWTALEDEEQLTPFAFSDREIVTYDNPASVSAKANYIKDYRLGGAALWDLSYDDFSGVFCDRGRFPLATALKATLTSPRSWCPAGERGFLDVPGCEPCPAGTYQPSENSMACMPCPQGLTTLATASTHSYHCILPCGSGSEYNYVTSSCDPCPLGYYRQEGRDPACLKCPPGHTTVTTASSDCVRSPEGVPEIIPRQIDVRATLTFTVSSCENQPVVVGAVRLLIADYFERLAEVWTGLCHDESCSNVHSDVTDGCENGDVKKRRRRQSGETRLLTSVTVSNVSEEVNTTDSTRHTHRVIAAALSDHEEYEPLSTYGIRFTKLETLETQTVCETGSVATNGRCEPCKAGSQHNNVTSTCTPCPLGHYQPLEGQTGCQTCPGVMTTLITGATSAVHCVSPCEARPTYCFNEGVCRWSEADRGAVFCQCPHDFQGDRCEVGAEPQSASNAGTVVGAVVGGILAFLIIVLIVVACCVCLRMRKAAVQLQPAEDRGGRGAATPNHYMTWGTFSKGSSAQRGVKFVDYIDYYMWLNSFSDQQQSGKSQPLHHSRPRPDQQPSPRFTVTTLAPSSTADPPPTEPNGHTPAPTGHTPTPNGNTSTVADDDAVHSTADQE
ncbi:uncharacterized protein LOC143285847 [Babylonia areolata]|uniref:uncharacterized protein LOC143285847 n=1 Tax=Babylonia areolata TaxID=304850 RepID=UPI003FD20527